MSLRKPSKMIKISVQAQKTKKMTTYNISRELPIFRQEGDSSDLQINVPEVLNMAGFTARLQVRSQADKLILSKTITPQGQSLLFDFTPEDTRLKSGTHRWELEVMMGERVITIGRGPFEIVKKIIPKPLP